MKNYYQIKEMGYVLPHPIYRKTVNTIRAYNFYRSISNREDEDGEINRSLEGEAVALAAVNSASVDYYIDAIHTALSKYVIEEYREPVFRHLVDAVEYFELERDHGISASTLKRWVQRWVFGVATELGENYFDEC